LPRFYGIAFDVTVLKFNAVWQYARQVRREMRSLVCCAALLVSGVGAGSAGADGLPVLGVDAGGRGVVARSGAVRYVTVPANGNTVVARVDPHGGRVLASRLIRGRFTIPAVTYDASAGGLSADGRTLVLIRPRASFPRAQTRLLVVDARRLRALRAVRLDGDFSFDAISPRGSLVYLIEYVSPSDPTRYRVRAYDLAAERLLARTAVDPHEPGEKMGGSPLTRATSPDGRWAYTLYDGAGKTPFVHALDTSTRRARCIDLDGLSGTNLSRLRLHVDAATHTLTVNSGRRAVVVIDTRSFRTSAPPAAAGLRWKPVAGASTAALAAVRALFILRRRRRQQPALAH
jgi:DNA-binding beta-propeller fold protein YncE